MVLVVVLEPSRDLAERGDRIRQRIDASIVAFEGFDETFRYAVRLRALDRREAGNEIERSGEVPARLLGRVGAAIVGQPFERRRLCPGGCRTCSRRPPASCSNHAAADARSDDGMPCDDLAVMGIDDEGDPDLSKHAISKPSNTSAGSSA